MSISALFERSPDNGIEPDRLTIRRPDDWHIHLRDGAMLKAVLSFTAAQFARGIIMPNLVPPVTTAEDSIAYRERILAARPADCDFQPLMTCYLTDHRSADEVERGFAEKAWVAAKLYPSGATTNAHHGVTDVRLIATVLDRMQKIGMPLLVHGEVTDPEVDIFDREACFIERIMIPLLQQYPALKVVMEHVTTSEGVALVREYAPRMAGTITPHHLTINRTSLFQGGLRPHLYCLPVAKREQHRLDLRQAATSGEPSFFIGTDTAPHVRGAKEAACGCAGIFVGATALQTYVQVFDEEGALANFEAFASLNGSAFYGLPPNTGTIELVKRPSRFPPAIEVDGQEVVVFRGDESLAWSIGKIDK